MEQSTWHRNSMDKAFYQATRTSEKILWNSHMPMNLDHSTVILKSVVPLPVSILCKYRYTYNDRSALHTMGTA